MSELILRMEHVSKSLAGDRGMLRVLVEVGLKVHAGECVALVGPSGSGKSTLLNLAAGLETPDVGVIELLGADLSAMAPESRAAVILSSVGVVHQAFHLIPFLTARENVEMPLRLAGVDARHRGERVAECLSAVGLDDRGGHRVTRLSGGEQQRVGIARAISNSPRLILADEPTGNLDAHTTQEIIELLFGLCRGGGVGMLLVTHDAKVAARADRVLVLHEGRVRASGPDGAVASGGLVTSGE